MVVSAILIYGDRGVIGLFTLLILIGLLFYDRVWIYSTYILSSIPGFWYAVTAYLYLLIAGLPINLYSIVMIYLRTTTYSLLVLFIGSIISPVELSNLIHKLKGGEKALSPTLLWRLTPLGLKYMYDSLSIGWLKGEPVKNRLAPAIAALLETGDRIEKSCYHRLKTPLNMPIYRDIDAKYTLILLVSPAILLLTLFLTHTSPYP